MITFNYMQDGQVKFDAFEDMMSLVFFVAANKISDDDFVSMDFGDGNEITGIDGLRQFTMDTIMRMQEENEEPSEEEYRKVPEELESAISDTDLGLDDEIAEEFDSYMSTVGMGDEVLGAYESGDTEDFAEAFENLVSKWDKVAMYWSDYEIDETTGKQIESTAKELHRLYDKYVVNKEED